MKRMLHVAALLLAAASCDVPPDEQDQAQAPAVTPAPGEVAAMSQAITSDDPDYIITDGNVPLGGSCGCVGNTRYKAFTIVHYGGSTQVCYPAGTCYAGIEVGPRVRRP